MQMTIEPLASCGFDSVAAIAVGGCDGADCEGATRGSNKSRDSTLHDFLLSECRDC